MQGDGKGAAERSGGRSELDRDLARFVEALQSEDAATRAEALRLFRTRLLMGNQDRIAAMLADGLDSRSATERRKAAETLVAIGLPAGLPLTLRYLEGKEARRRRAVELLGEICVANRLPPGYALARALEDRAPSVRRAAERAWLAIRLRAEQGRPASPPPRTAE